MTPARLRPAAPPAVSVIIATYNWSSALRCAIRSVLGQTLQDFEVLVVGDACTDDSEAVVAAFGDPRIRWINLEANTGSQQGPNNRGLTEARGEWVAYLGHDDVWAPRHLEATLAAALAAGANAAVGGMLSYRPPGANWYMIAGMFPGGQWSDTDFVPPSALLHRHDLVRRIGGWRRPLAIILPTDCDFFARVREAGGLAASGELTVFKFNAALRRNAYQRRSSDEQERCLDGLTGGDRFIAAELAKALGAAAVGKLERASFPDPSRFRPGQLHRQNRRAKGVDPRFRPERLRSLDAPERFGLEDQPQLFEWHALEQDGGASFRWTATSQTATIELPVRPDRRLSLQLGVVAALRDEFVDGLSLAVAGAPIETRIEKSDGGWLVSGRFDPAEAQSDVPYLQIELRGLRCARPVDLGINEDKRFLGVAVSWIALAPDPDL